MSSALEDAELVQLVVQCHKEASDAFMEQTQIESPFPGQRGAIIDNPWPIYQEFYDGKQWARMGRMPGWKSTPKDDLCFSTCESYTTFITDNRAKAQFIPTESEDYDLANKTQSAWSMWASWVSLDVQQSIAVLDSRKFGIGWLHLKRDKGANPIGQSLEIVNPDSIKVDPDHTIDKMLAGKEPTYLIYEYSAQLGDLRDTFDKAQWTSFDPRWMPRGSTGMWDRVLKFFDKSNGSAENPAISVPVYELWIQDTSKIIFEQDLDINNVLVKRKKKFPGGRRVIVSGGIVLLDEANPYRHGQFPFTPIFAYPQSGKFYCAGDIQNIIGQQVMLNRTHQLLYDSTTKAGGGIALINPRYGITADMVTNDPMQVIECTDVNQSMRMESFSTPPRHLFNYADLLRKSAQDAAGLHDISNGVYTPGNKTAVEVAALTESDKTRVRKAARVLSWSNERIARQWLSNCSQWDDWTIFLRISNNEGDDMPVTMTGSDLRQMKDGELTKDAIQFDVTIADSSTLPTYFQERKQTALDLFDRQVIDAEALLEGLEYPGWRGIVARMNAATQAATQVPPEAQAPMPEAQMPIPTEALMPQEQPQSPMEDAEFMQGVQEVAAATGMSPDQVMAMALGGQS